MKEGVPESCPKDDFGAGGIKIPDAADRDTVTWQVPF
jgi:hypothetical protein